MSLRRYYTLSNLYTVINLLVLSTVIYCGVDVFYTLAGSKLTDIETKRVTTERVNEAKTPGKRKSFDYYRTAIDRGLFGKAQESAPKSREINVEDLEPTALKVALLGTVSGDEETARAVILDKTKRGFQFLFKVGDTIQNAEIIKILRGKVVLKVGDKNQILTMEEKPGATAITARRSARRPRPASRQQQGTTITLDSATVNKSLQNMTQLLSQVRVRPHYRNGKTDGFLLSQVRPNTIFTRLGLRNGDVIQSIDGETIESPDDIVDFYDELKDGSPVSLEIQRRGLKKVLNYRFK